VLAGEERFELSISRFRAERFNPGLATPLHCCCVILAKWMGVEPTWSSWTVRCLCRSATTSKTWYPARDSNPNLNVRSVLS